MKKLSGLFLGDRVIWIVFFALCIISVVEVFSALSTLTYQSGSYILPIARHAAFLITGFVVVQIVHRMPCRYFRAMLPFAVLASVLLLVLLQLGFGITQWRHEMVQFFRHSSAAVRNSQRHTRCLHRPRTIVVSDR